MEKPENEVESIQLVQLKLIINIFKLPFHIFSWETVTLETLKINLLLSPAIALGFFFGVRVVKQINNELYRKFILVVTGVGAVFILLN